MNLPRNVLLVLFLRQAALAVRLESVDSLEIINPFPSAAPPTAPTIHQIEAAPSTNVYKPPGEFSIQNPMPGLFRWVGGATPAAGETADGILTVSMTRERDSGFDKVVGEDEVALELYVRVRLADIQPAPAGSMLIHCGGPGSTRKCLGMGALELPASDFKLFDLFSIDQRGLGDNTPNIDCPPPVLPKAPGPKSKQQYSISDFTDCDCALPDGSALVGECFANVDPLNAKDVLAVLTSANERGKRCYNSAKFQLKGMNFLDYVGTQYVAYDLETLRMAWGDRKLSLYGESYGTQVAGVYASAFPENVGRVVINGNMDPAPTARQYAEGGANSQNNVLNQVFKICAEQSECPIHDDPFGSLERLFAKMRTKHGISAKANAGRGSVKVEIGGLLAYFSMKLAPSSFTSDWWKIPDMIARLLSKHTQEEAAANLLDQLCEVEGVKTWRVYGVCIGEGQVGNGQLSFLPQAAILGNDAFGRVAPSQGKLFVNAIAQEYGTIGAGSFLGCYSGFSQWGTTPTPPSPLGHPTLKVLVVGNLYDPETSYGWSQKMHSAFPAGSLLTWQGAGHIMVLTSSYANSTQCNNLVMDYIATGNLPVDGYVCHTKIDADLAPHKTPS